jgi:putative secretion ATPase (PEP-CTERM system associated)
MYEQFYGLASKPFQLNPDPSFYFGSKEHSRAKAYLDYGVQRNEGFIVITGEVGAGKTTLVRGLLDSLDSEKTIAANLVTTQVDENDILRLVGAAFGVAFGGTTKADMLMALEAYLVNQVKHGRRCLLLVDEAQNLSLRAVEELRMLSNFQFETQALLQTFLIGQPEFRAILQNPNMHQLRQRVTACCHIGPMDARETRNYIEHRLKCAGSNGSPEFSDEAFEEIFNASHGIPRRINFVCDRLMLHGFLKEITKLEIDDVREIVKEIEEETPPIKVLSHRVPEALVDMTTDDFSKLAFEEGLSSALGSQIDRLGFEQYDARMRRLEGSVLRLERINLEILSMMKKIIPVAVNQKNEALP